MNNSPLTPGILRPVSPQTVQIILFTALMGEVLSSTFWLESLGMNACRLIHFLSGIIIGGCILVKTQPAPAPKQVHRGIIYLLLITLIGWAGTRLHHLFSLNPLDYAKAEMLPVIKVMAERFWSFQPVYEIIPEIWGGTVPVYLPGSWLPFVPAVVFNFDLRWVTTFFIISGIVGLFTFIRGSKNSLIIWIPIGLWFDFMLYNRNETLVLTEQGVVYGYYMLLALALYRRAYFWIGVLFACCFLSQYTIVFFAGSVIACIYFYESTKHFRSLLAGAVISGLLLMTLGRAWSSLIQFMEFPAQYVKDFNSNPIKYQEVKQKGLGFIHWLQEVDSHWIYGSMLLVLVGLGVLIFYFYRKWAGPFYLLAGLKFTLVVFYHLVLIPYPNLFYTSVWVSVVLVYIYFNHTEQKPFESL